MKKKAAKEENKNQEGQEYSAQTEVLKEEIKKSAIHARDTYDYQKLCVNRPGLLPCRYEEDREDLYFYYEIKGMEPIKNIGKETREKKYQILINFSKLEDLLGDYVLKLKEENLYYDENGLLYLKERDIHARGERPDKDRFLEAYKCFAAGILGKKYSVVQLQESGIELCKEESWFAPVYRCQSAKEIADVLRTVKRAYEHEQKSTMQSVKRMTYQIWKAAAVITMIGTLLCGSYAGYLAFKTVPEQKRLLAANEAFIQKDYRTCVESLRETEPEKMETNTLYILAYAYANMESFRQDEMRTIIDSISVSSNPKILEYWIRIGRLETKKAQELALSLSDDKLLIYAYMKEADDLENNTQISGDEKKKRLDELESQIEKLGDKYEQQEESAEEEPIAEEPVAKEPTAEEAPEEAPAETGKEAQNGTI